MAFLDFLTGTKGTFNPLPTTPLQQQITQQIGQKASSLLSKDNQFNFAPIAEQARANFQQRTIPTLAERFTAMGGGLRSSAFQGALGGASSALERDLAALQQQYGLQQNAQQNQLLQILLGLSSQPQFSYTPPTPGLLQPLVGALGSGLGMYATGGLSGGANALQQLLSLLTGG